MEIWVTVLESPRMFVSREEKLAEKIQLVKNLPTAGGKGRNHGGIKIIEPLGGHLVPGDCQATEWRPKIYISAMGYCKILNIFASEKWQPRYIFWCVSRCLISWVPGILQYCYTLLETQGSEPKVPSLSHCFPTWLLFSHICTISLPSPSGAASEHTLGVKR